MKQDFFPYHPTMRDIVFQTIDAKRFSDKYYSAVNQRNKSSSLVFSDFKVENSLDNLLHEEIKRSCALYRFDALWQCFHGQGVKVAIIDTGIALAKNPAGETVPHPAFPEGSVVRHVRFYRGAKSTSLEAVRDTNGHGTHCAGLIGARPLVRRKADRFAVACEPAWGLDSLESDDIEVLDNQHRDDFRWPRSGSPLDRRWYPVIDDRVSSSEAYDSIEGMSQDRTISKEFYRDEHLFVPFHGMAPLAQLMIYKVSHDVPSEADGIPTDQGDAHIIDIIRAIYDALHHGADIISISLTAPTDTPELYAAIHLALQKQKLVICAAGNEGSLRRINIGYPARYGGVITVASHDKYGRPSQFSSAGGEIDFAGPGEDVWSTWLNGYARLSGTSMATPWVAGIAALLLSKHRHIAARAARKAPEGIGPTENETPLNNNEQLREHLLRMAAHPGRFDPLDGYGPLWPGDYSERGLT